MGIHADTGRSRKKVPSNNKMIATAFREASMTSLPNGWEQARTRISPGAVVVYIVIIIDAVITGRPDTLAAAGALHQAVDAGGL